MKSLLTESVRTGVRLLPLLAAALLVPAGARAQVVEEPILAGQAFLADSVMSTGSVFLHRLTTATHGEIDSMALAPDGTFLFALPSVPDEAAGDMYFASVRHDGVMYFGPLISRAADLDSLYEIHAYDTLVVQPGESPAMLESRSLFFEPSGSEWAITDVFQLRNDRARTLVPAEGGWVWSYPLPVGAKEFAPVEGMARDVVSLRGDTLTYVGAVQPGTPPLIVVRYLVDSLTVTIPTPGELQAIDVLVREPAPAIAIAGLVQEQSIQMEQSGSTYRRFAGQGVELPELRITMAEESEPPPVQWIAVVLALVLLGGGLLALRRGPAAREAPDGDAGARRAAGAGANRQAVLYEIAQLDEEYAAEASPSAARTREYKRRRAELMRRLKDLR